MVTEPTPETTDATYVLNPEAIGDPHQTPIVQASPALIRMLNPCHCGGINGFHREGCVSRDDGCEVRPA